MGHRTQWDVVGPSPKTLSGRPPSLAQFLAVGNEPGVLGRYERLLPTACSPVMTVVVTT